MSRKIKLDEKTLDSIKAMESFNRLTSKQAWMCLEFLRTCDRLQAVRSAYRCPKNDREARMYAAVYFDSPRVKAFLNEVGTAQSDVLELLDKLASGQFAVDKIVRGAAMVGAIALLGKSPSERTAMLHRVEEKLAERESVATEATA